ncbi:MAG: hypothetical protein MRJ68_14265 [Nitrospira sp.]|nr:hypothetical protein [Nitrospira sp.]
MKKVVASITMNKALGLTLGGVFIATCGLSSATEAMPTGGVNGAERSAIVLQYAMGSGAEIARLVGTRDHDEDPTPDGSTQQMNNTKKKTDQSMKQGSDSKSRAGQGAYGHMSTKKNKSPKPGQQEQDGDRPDDRRQGGNINPKP